MQPRTHPAIRSWLLLAAAALAACGTPGDPERAERPGQGSSSREAVPASAALPWTREFQVSSTLIADEVTIEGPPGLIDHVAFTQSPDQPYSARTTAEGFLQEVTCDPDAPLPIRVQLDNLAISALRRVRVLERVAEGPVRVRARGDAYWKNLSSGAEQRAESVELTGARPR